MPSSRIRPDLALDWLTAAAARDPVAHAYALWDLERSPAASQFTTAVVGGTAVGYLLVWVGRPERPVAHLHVPDRRAEGLWDRLPSPPFVAVVPRSGAAALERIAPHRASERLTLMYRPRSPAPPPSPAVRRLGPGDAPALRAFAGRQTAREVTGYAALDLATDPAWGAFDDGSLVGVARAAVRSPRGWILAGVFVDPAARDRGHGAGLVSAFLAAAEAAEAPTGLFVLDSARAARHLYERTGFRATGERDWVEARGGGVA